MGEVASQPQPPALALEDVWLKFHLRYYKQRVTFRGFAIEGVGHLLRRATARTHRTGEFWALRGVDLVVRHQEVLGIIGFNGAGKSTLLRVMAGIYTPDRGKVTAHGRISTLLSLGSGFDTRRPGRENIYNNGIMLGLSVEEIDRRVDEIIEMSGLGDFIDAPVGTYSSGMRGRLGFAVAVCVDPDIMLIDEVIGTGDEKFRTRVGNVFDQFAARGKTIVLVTHSIGMVKRYCTQAIWLDQGKVHMRGAPEEVAKAYLEASQAQ